MPSRKGAKNPRKKAQKGATKPAETPRQKHRNTQQKYAAEQKSKTQSRNQGRGFPLQFLEVELADFTAEGEELPELLLRHLSRDVGHHNQVRGRR